MEHLLGLSALTLVALLTFILGNRWPKVRLVLAVALLIRVVAALLHFYVVPLPDGAADAITFEQLAWEWAAGGVSGVAEEFHGPDSYFYSVVIGLLYAITDRSPLMAQALSVLAGVGGVLVAWLLARDLWGERFALKAAWVTALFPTLIMYSALTMREAFIALFLLLGLLGVVRWARGGGFMPVIGAATSFVAATFFHGGLLVAALAFGGLVVVQESRRLLVLLPKGRLSLVSVVLLLIGSLAIGGYIASGAGIQKLGNVSQALSTDRWMKVIKNRTQDSAAYPAWTMPRSGDDLLWVVPVRTFYLLFSPFPWDVRQAKHLIGLMDGLLYLGLGWLVWRNRKSIWADAGARAVLLVLLPLVFAFAVGSGNFGTALRHRAKFVAVMIVLAAPLLPRLVVRRSSVSHSVIEGRKI